MRSGKGLSGRGLLGAQEKVRSEAIQSVRRPWTSDFSRGEQ